MLLIGSRGPERLESRGGPGVLTMGSYMGLGFSS